MSSRHLNRRVTRDEFQLQGLYVGDGWVTLFSSEDKDAAESRLRVFRSKSPLVTYRIEHKRVPMQQAQS